MPVIGIRIQKEQGGVPFENRYFTNLGSLDDAENYAGALVVFEKAIFGISVAFTKVNLWIVGATPRQFRSVPISGFGSQGGAFPTALEMTLKMLFPATNTYPYYKEYRVAINASETDTRTWGATYLASVLDALEAADENSVWANNTTKAGVSLGDPVLQTKVEFSQLHKRWYNRQPE